MQNRFTLALFSAVALAFAGCADHAGSTLASGGPAAPINDPDTRLLPNPGENTGTGQTGGTGSARNGGGSSTGAGGSTGSSTNEPSGEPSSGGQTGSGSGGQAGSPVPEPGTLLLFGTGLAGLAGAAFRRRRRKD